MKPDQESKEMIKKLSYMQYAMIKALVDHDMSNMDEESIHSMLHFGRKGYTEMSREDICFTYERYAEDCDDFDQDLLSNFKLLMVAYNLYTKENPECGQ